MNAGRLEKTDTASNTSAGKSCAIPEMRRRVDRRVGRDMGGRAGRKPGRK